MKTNFTDTSTVQCICAIALLSGAVACHAEAPPRSAPLVRSTPEIIHEASASTQLTPAREGGSVLSRDNGTPPQHDIFRDSPKNLENVPNGCSHNNASLCYDYRTGSAMYKPMRRYLPDLPGMTPHNLSIRRNKIVAQYTFK
ncbi:MAG: hypothetical protein ABI905_09075 [Betaproteobacteria bacterium]